MHLTISQSSCSYHAFFKSKIRNEYPKCSRRTTQGSGVRGRRARLSSRAKACKAPHPLQPIVRPRRSVIPLGYADYLKVSYGRIEARSASNTRRTLVSDRANPSKPGNSVAAVMFILDKSFSASERILPSSTTLTIGVPITSIGGGALPSKARVVGLSSVLLWRPRPASRFASKEMCAATGSTNRPC